MSKKKILFHSNCSRVFTGFGKNAKNILSHLFSTGKYEVIEVANGVKEDSPALDLFPWKCIGSFPSDAVIEKECETNNSTKSKAGYGHFRIDEIILKEKPDIYIGSEDIWAFNGFCEKPWWSHLNTILWITLDSTPILDTTSSTARNTDKFITWSNFAQKELANQGVTNSECIHGPVDHKNFFKLSEDNRRRIRNDNEIKAEDYIIGFVFRNQLRKSVPNLLDGFIKFKKENKGAQAKLLLHTNWQEGWDIPKLINEKGLENKDVLTTYFCSKCKKYKVQPFCAKTKKDGEKQECPHCNSKESFNTSSVHEGPSEQELNEIYNIMDVYCHPFTSGGQELPIQEAKLCELITLVTDYSCGQDCSSEDSGGMPLSWNEYREPGTQFIKASTCPHSIANKLSRVFKMSKHKKTHMGEKARDFVIKNYSIEVSANKLMNIIDKMPRVKDKSSLDKEKLKPDLSYKMPENISDEEFILKTYKNLLKVNLKTHSEVFEFLLKKIRSGTSREKIFTALKGNAKRQAQSSKKKTKTLADYLDEADKGRRMAVVLPKSIGDIFMATSLLEDIKKTYENYNLYFICQEIYHEILEGNPHIHKVLPITPECHDALTLEGFSGRTDRPDEEGFFEVAILLHINNQRVLNYTRNGKDKISLDLCT